MAVACKPLLGCWGLTRVPRRPADRPPTPPRAPPWPPEAATPGGPWERATAAALVPLAHGSGAPRASRRGPHRPPPAWTTRMRPRGPGLGTPRPATTTRPREPPGDGLVVLEHGAACAPAAAAGPRQPSPRRAGDATQAWTQGAVPPDSATPVRPVTRPHRPPHVRASALARVPARHPPHRCHGQGPPPRRCPPAGAPTAPPSALRSAHRYGGQHACRLGLRLPPGASPAVGPGTGWRAGDDHRDTGRVAWGGHAWSAFPLGHARQQRCAQQPNARGEPRQEPQRGTSGGCWRRLQCDVRS